MREILMPHQVLRTRGQRHPGESLVNGEVACMEALLDTLKRESRPEPLAIPETQQGESVTM